MTTELENIKCVQLSKKEPKLKKCRKATQAFFFYHKYEKWVWKFNKDSQEIEILRLQIIQKADCHDWEIAVKNLQIH